MPRAAKTSSKVSKPARRVKRDVNGKAKPTKASQGRPEKNRVKNAPPIRTEPSFSSIGTIKDKQNHIRTIYDAEPVTDNSLSDLDEGDPMVGRPPHRMSLSFGHGHMLEPDEDEEPITDLTQRKRTRSMSTSESPSKRVRFDPEANETRQIQEGKIISRRVSPAVPVDAPWPEVDNPLEDRLKDARELPTDPDSYLLDKLNQCPEVLGLQSVANLFRALQSEAETFGKRWFSRSTQEIRRLGGQHSRKNFPLHELEHEYSALYWTTLNLLDVPTDDAKQGWLKFFTRKTQRPALVYGILGEWLSERVFKDSSFGLSDRIKQLTRDTVDVPYLHYDSFVRAKHRAGLVEAAFKPSELTFTLKALKRDSSKLADELLIVFAPLMPTWRIDDPFGKNLSPTAAEYRDRIKTDLINLIMKAAGLNLSLVRTGENTTVFRTAHRLDRGREYNPMAPMDCINLKEKMDLLRQHPDIANEKKLMVRMTCWPRIEAYVGHGLDQEQVEAEQERLMEKEIEDVILDAGRHATSPTVQQFEKSYRKFCWDCAAPDTFPQLPSELWKRHTEWHDKIEMKGRAARLERKRARLMQQEQAKIHESGNESGPDPENDSESFDENSSDSSSSSGKDYDHTTNGVHGEDKIPRGAYISVFDKLVKHQVYCEWVKPTPGDAGDMSGPQEPDPDRKDLRQLNSLQSVVRKAREQSKSPLIKLTDFKIRTWNLYASNNLWIEWASALALVVYVAGDRYPSSMAAFIEKMRELISVRFEDVHQLLHQILPNLSLWEHSSNEFVKKMLERVGSPSDPLEKLFEKLKDLIPMPPPIDLEGSDHSSVDFGPAAAFKTAILSPILSALSALIPRRMPLVPPPLTDAVYYEYYEMASPGPAIPLTSVAVEPAPSYHARWW